MKKKCYISAECSFFVSSLKDIISTSNSLQISENGYEGSIYDWNNVE